jgi:zinc protease
MNTIWHGLKILAVGLILSAPLAAQQPVTPLPEGVRYVTGVEGISEYRLPNGLRVLLFPDPTKTNVTVNITYMVGSRHEDYGETGMAHLLEHLLFKGSTNHTDTKKELKDHGASPNGTTSFDRTNYFETFQATNENLEWALALEADRMVNSFIAKKDLDSEMTVVRNEFENGENNPVRVLRQRVLSTAYLWHNYGKSTIGARSDIEQVPIDRLQAFYRHFYQPDNAVLVVAGKIDAAQTLGLIHKYFAPIPKPDRQLRRTYTIEPAQDGERSVTLRRVGDIQVLYTVYHIPSGTHEELAAIDIASSILGDQPSGRLYKALVEPGKAVEVGAGTQMLKDPGFLMTVAALRKDQSLDEAETVLFTMLDGLKDAPFTDEEVNRAKTQYQKSFELLLNNSQSAALQLSEWQSMGDWRLLFLYRDRIQKATRDEVQKAAEKYLIPSNRTVGRFIPTTEEPLRAEIPAAPDAETLVGDYQSSVKVAEGEEFDPSLENIEKRTVRIDLPEGPKLSLLAKKTRGEQVVVEISLNFGDENSLKGHDIAASLVGDMLTRGTTKHTRQQIQDEFDRMKTQIGVSGSATSGGASLRTNRENLQAALALAVEILREPVFPQNEFDELKRLVLASLENSKSDPSNIASTAFSRFIAPYPKGDVRYVPTIDEQIADYTALTLDQVKAFYQKFYGASDSQISIIGDFDSDETQTQLKQLFAGWKSPAKYTRVENNYTKLQPVVETFQTPDKANAMWIAGSTFPMADTDPDYPAIHLASYIFGNSGMGSRLFARIRDKEGLSYGVGGQFGIQFGGGNNRGSIYAYAICAPQNAPKVEAVFKEELAKLLDQGFTVEEVEAAKKSWQQAQLVNRTIDGNLVGHLTSFRFWNRPMTFMNKLEQDIQALTPEQILAAVKRHIDPSSLSFFRAGDFAKAGITW